MDTHAHLEEYFATKNGIAVLRARGASLEDAEDAVQEAALKALKTKSPFAGDAAFSTWFYRVIWNAYAEQKRRIYGVGKIVPEFVPLTECAERVSDSNPHREYVTQERRDILMREMASLNDAERGVLFAAYFLGILSKEQSIQRKISEAAVKSRLHHCRKKLRQRLVAALR